MSKLYASVVQVGGVAIFELLVDPSGQVSAARGSLGIRSDAGNVTLYQNTDGLTSWSEMSGGGGGASSANSGVVWFVDAHPDVVSSAYSNGIRYVPLAQNQWIEFQLVAAITGNLQLQLVYAMSGISANAITLRVDRVAVGVGSDPSTALTTGTPFNVTPGNDVLLKATTGSESADLTLAVTAGDLVRVRLTRTDATHPGNVQVIELRAV